MKISKLIFFCVLCLVSYICKAQTGYNGENGKRWLKDTTLINNQLKINTQGGAIIGGYNKNADAVLEASSTTRGFLAPRMTTAQRNAITAITPGLLIYNTTDSAFNVWRSSGWTTIGGSGGISTNGNGTTINSTAVDIRGNLNRTQTYIKGNPYNQIFALEDSSADNKYHFIWGSNSGIPSVYGYGKSVLFRADSSLNLRGDESVFIEGSTGIGIEVGSFSLDISGDAGGAGDVLTAVGDGSATWQAASGGAFTVSNDVTTATRLYPVYTTGTGSVTPYIGTTKHTYYPLTGKGTWGTDSLQERASDVFGADPQTLYYNWNFNQDSNKRVTMKVGNKGSGTSVMSEIIVGNMDSAEYINLGAIPATSTAYGGAAGRAYLNSGSGMINGLKLLADFGDLVLSTSGHDSDLVVNRDVAASYGNTRRNSFIGIGRTNPPQLLSIYNAQSANTAIALQSNITGRDSTDGWYIGTSGTVNYLLSYENTSLRITEPLGVTIGTGASVMAPVRTLSIQDASLPAISLHNSTSGTTAGDGFQIQTSGTDVYLWNYENDDIHIATNATERMVINNAGSIRFNAYGAGTATFDASGNITSVSDERLKNIKGVYKSGLKELLGVEPIIYKWNEKSGLEQKYNYAGFSAQNVKENIPFGTGENSEGYLSLQDRAILATLVNAVKELNAEIEKLKKK